MNIKKCLSPVAWFTALISSYATEPTITDVTVRQRYPQDSVIEISYKITGDIAAAAKERGLIASLKVTATDTGANKTYTAANISGDTSLTAGIHSVAWDMVGDGLPSNSSNVIITVLCEKTPATYCVVDISAGSSAASYPVSYLNAPPNGGFNVDEYKSTKLVLRRIESGTFIKGRDQANETHLVTLTKPYYCGIYEMTQKQYQLVMGSNPAAFKGDKRPVEQVSYDVIRGSSNGSQWPASAAVDANSFVGKFRARTGLSFDLPTGAQWEYACRAGTTSKYNNGGNAVSDLKKLGRYSGNVSDGKGGYTTSHTVVGSYASNAWGLYDMHGNVQEWCLDFFSSTGMYGVDPKGPSSGSDRVIRGGCFASQDDSCASYGGYSYHSSYVYSAKNPLVNYIGFRMVRTLSSVETSGTLCAGTVSWTPEGGGADHTTTTPEEVPYSYFDNDYPTLLAEYGGDYEAAANATAANGLNKVWECFVSGTNPTNETSRFKAKIEMVDGMPSVTWDPNLNTNGVIRTYKVYGKETLDGGGEWQYPTNSLHRFFKVEVGLP